MNPMLDVKCCENEVTPEPVEHKLERRLAGARELVSSLEMALTVLRGQPKLLETLNILRKVGI